MTSLKHRTRLLAQRFGIELSRYPQADPLWRVARLLSNREIDVVLDVGANDGGFAANLRSLGFTGEIHSFEPIAAVHSRLNERTSRDPKWHAHNLALGSESTVMRINIAGNNGASSSLLPMRARHRDAAPEATFIGAEDVQVRRLDEVAGEIGLTQARRVYLKIDVQGFEKEVLEGAAGLLDGPVVGMQLELSLVPLYEGGLEWSEGVSLARRAGLNLVGLNPGFTDQRTGELLQFDAVFARGAGV